MRMNDYTIFRVSPSRAKKSKTLVVKNIIDRKG